MYKKLTRTEAAAIVAAGGATLNKGARTVSFKKGFQVSKKDGYILNAEKIGEIAGAINEILNRMGGADFCGVWVDGGRVYIDISERIKNRKKAEAIGRGRRQLSIFDWSKNDCIFL